MPIREYMCNDCGHIFELIISSYEPKRRTMCPHCETTTAEILPSAVGGYKIKGNNSSSVTPKRSTSFGKKQ